MQPLVIYSNQSSQLLVHDHVWVSTHKIFFAAGTRVDFPRISSINSTSPLQKDPSFLNHAGLRSRVGLTAHHVPAIYSRQVSLSKKTSRVSSDCWMIFFFAQTESTGAKHGRNRKATPEKKSFSLREVWLVVSQSVMESLMKPKGGCAWSKSFHQQIDQDIGTFP